jgi:hypothetical protein
MTPFNQKQSALKFVVELIPPQAENIADIRGYPAESGINDTMFLNEVYPYR